MTTKKEFHWFWAWEDEKEEIWLCEMSQKGWHFKSVSLPGYYILEQGEPIDYVYRLDYFSNRKDMDGYLQIFEDAGWDYMGEMNSWQYFRHEAVEGEMLEIFTDNQSKAKKYQRIMFFLIILLPIFLNFISISNQADKSDIIQIASILMGMLLVLYVYAMVRLLHRIMQLKK